MHRRTFLAVLATPLFAPYRKLTTVLRTLLAKNPRFVGMDWASGPDRTVVQTMSRCDQCGEMAAMLVIRGPASPKDAVFARTWCRCARQLFHRHTVGPTEYSARELHPFRDQGIEGNPVVYLDDLVPRRRCECGATVATEDWEMVKRFSPEEAPLSEQRDVLQTYRRRKMGLIEADDKVNNPPFNQAHFLAVGYSTARIFDEDQNENDIFDRLVVAPRSRPPLPGKPCDFLKFKSVEEKMLYWRFIRAHRPVVEIERVTLTSFGSVGSGKLWDSCWLSRSTPAPPEITVSPDDLRSRPAPPPFDDFLAWCGTAS